MLSVTERPIAPFVFWLAIACGGCAQLKGPEFGPYDTAEGLNRVGYNVFDWVDKRALAPAARGYRWITPGWWRTGVNNVFVNLRTLDSSVNGFLQGKWSKGGTDLARIAINSTVGVGGFFDVAKRMGLRYGNEDLGQTFAVWGYSRTRYVFFPTTGPTSMRDLPGRGVSAIVPRLILGSAYNLPVGLLDFINGRAQLLQLTDARDDSAVDPYVFTRDAFFQGRAFVIFDGDPPIADDFDMDFEDDEY
ncbi:MAG: VacJ family lipoprotein [Pseudomonadota bacterium]